MQCITPMFYYYKIGDKKHGKVVPRTAVLDTLNYEPNYIRSQLEAKNNAAMSSGHKYIKIPCQKCWACQLKYSAEWATRIMLEAKKYENNYFITLTYNDDNLPIAEHTGWIQYDKNPNDPWGERIKTEQKRENDGTWGPTLNPYDMDTFLNSLRKHFKDKGHEGIKYFYAGEYGSTTARPHYHIILMNCPLNPFEFYDPHIDSNYKAHFKSHELENLWATGPTGKRKPKGMIDIAELEWSAAAYVARYCTKKLNPDQDKRAYLENGKLPEFVRMSKGIGFDYFNDNMESIYKNDEIIMKTIHGNVGAIKPPRAFDRRLEKANPKLYRMIKKSREKAADRSMEYTKAMTDATDKQMLEQKTRNLENKMSMLPRTGDW